MYLIRCAETGREQQARLGKLRKDLACVIREQLPDATIETAPGRVFVTAHDDAATSLAALPGVATVSPCVRVPFADLERTVLDLAQRLRSNMTFAVRVRRGGGRSGASANEPTPSIARRLANAIVAQTGARTDLDAPDALIGI
jgi:adenylyl- and sulfurtransferase ThiI